jgi:hypothetical protein
MQLVRHMTTHGEFEPYLSADTAIRRAERVAEQLGGRFEPIPDGSDPVVVAANAARPSPSRTSRPTQAGKSATRRAGALRSGRRGQPEGGAEAGLVYNTSAFLAVGDDGHLLMTHARGADNNDVHLWAYKTFFRQVWVAEVLGYRWYGLGQDLVGASTVGTKTEELAGLTPKFLKLLADALPPPEKARFGELQAAFDRWRTGAGRGNPGPTVRRQRFGAGPRVRGVADAAAGPSGRAGHRQGRAVGLQPARLEALRCRADGTLERYLKADNASGVVLEVWDVEAPPRLPRHRG